MDPSLSSGVTFRTVIPASSFARARARSRRNIKNVKNARVVLTLGLYPPDPHLLINNVQNSDDEHHCVGTARRTRRRAHCAQHGLTYRHIWEVTLSLSNRCILLSG